MLTQRENKFGVSIVIPTYNRADFLPQAIDSALDQTYRNIEVIVVDDGSTDYTLDVCRRYAGRIRYIRKENGGIGSALNVGIRNMRGEWFKWLSSDDYLQPEAVELLLQRAHEANAKIAYSSYMLVDERRRVIGFHPEHEKSFLGFAAELVQGHVGNGSSVLIHKCVFEKVGVFDEHLKVGEDYDFWLRACLIHRIRFCCLQAFTVNYRVHRGQLRFHFMSDALANRQRIRDRVLRSVQARDPVFYRFLHYHLYPHTLRTFPKFIRQKLFLLLPHPKMKQIALNLWREKAVRGVHDYSVPDHLQFDTYNYCNLACRYCYAHTRLGRKSTPYERPIGPAQSTRMPMHLIERLLSQTVGLKFSSIRPYMNGDPLFEDRLPKIIEIIRKYNPSPIVVFTNATNYHARSLLVNPEINEIHVTISAATPETYAYVHGRALYKQALRTLDWLETHIGPTQKIILHFVITKQNLPEIEAWKRQYARFEQTISGLHRSVRDKQITDDICPSIDTIPLTTLKGHLFGMPCHIWNNQAVSVHGDYIQCCNSPIDLAYGNIADTPLLEAWRKRCANKMENESCRSCNCRAPSWREILEKAS